MRFSTRALRLIMRVGLRSRGGEPRLFVIVERVLDCG